MTTRRLFKSLLYIVLASALFLVGTSIFVDEQEKQDPDSNVLAETTGEYTVVTIIDGDTIEVSDGEETYKVRLIGVDTPELHHPSKPVECFAKEASDFLDSILRDKTVIIESDTTQDNEDKYGRLLRYVFTKDGININEVLIAEGYGFEYTYDVPYKYQATFRNAQLVAREESKGLWGGICEYEGEK